MATAVKRTSQRTLQRGGIFRVLAGGHYDKGPPHCMCDACEKSAGPNNEFRDKEGRAPQHKYWQRLPNSPADYDNDIIESDRDLCALFNKDKITDEHEYPPHMRKFERLDANNAPVHLPAPYPLEKMSVRQLLTLAEEEEIDLKGATKKEDILKILQAADL